MLSDCLGFSIGISGLCYDEAWTETFHFQFYHWNSNEDLKKKKKKTWVKYKENLPVILPSANKFYWQDLVSPQAVKTLVAGRRNLDFQDQAATRWLQEWEVNSVNF